MSNSEENGNGDSSPSNSTFIHLQKFETIPTEAVAIDTERNVLLTVHSSRNIIGNFPIVNTSLPITKSYQTWDLGATTVTTHQNYVFFVTNPYGKLVKADKQGNVIEKYEIWHRFLTNLGVYGEFLFVTDRRNDVVMQFDLNKTLSEENSMLIGRGHLLSPQGTCVLDSYLLVIQSSGSCAVFDLASGFHLCEFGRSCAQIGESVVAGMEQYHMAVIIGSGRSCVDAYCIVEGSEVLDDHGCPVPQFSHVASLGLGFDPTSAVLHPKLELLFVLKSHRHAASTIDVYRINANRFDFMWLCA